MLRAIVFLIALQILSPARHGSASVVRIEFNGVINSKIDDFDLLHSISEGDHFSGFYTYEDSVVGEAAVNGGETVYRFQGLGSASVEFALEEDDFFFTGTFPADVSEIRIFDGDQALARQRYHFFWADQLDGQLTLGGVSITAANYFYGQLNDPRNNRFIISEELTDIPDFRSAGYLSIAVLIRQENSFVGPPTGTPKYSEHLPR
jgi:hypothetical protein